MTNFSFQSIIQRLKGKKKEDELLIDEESALTTTITPGEKDALLSINNNNNQKKQNNSTPTTTRERMIALDVMRGMTIMLMIIVNNQPTEGFYLLEHAEWFGITPTDCIFPFFIYVMGYAIGIVFRNEWKDEVILIPPTKLFKDIIHYFNKTCRYGWCCCLNNKHYKDYNNNEFKEEEEIIKYLYIIPMRKSLYEIVSKWTKIIRRTILMFLIGFSFSLIGKSFDFTQVRIFGVLQRISICYFFVTCLIVFIPWTIIQILIVVLLQVIYIAITFGLYIPQDGAGEGCGVRGEIYDPQCTAQGYIDRLILSRDHTWRHLAFDPEGLLSTLSAITNAYLGALSFKLAYLAGKDKFKVISHWFLLGCPLILVGLGIDFVGLPIGKKLWTTSFSFVTSGIACLFLAIVMYVVDILKFNKYWTSPFVWIGTNPLVMYVVPTFVVVIMAKIYVPYQGKETNLFNFLYYNIAASWIKPSQLAAALFGLGYELLFIPLAFVLYWRKIFIKL
ncbi:hypothetical protein ABK040_001872 [Willaertia magna]